MKCSGLMTIDQFNKLAGKETLHPLISMVDLSHTKLNRNIRIKCDFFGLLCYGETTGIPCAVKEPLRFIHPGEIVEIPSADHCSGDGYMGVLFHPDLLCDTPLQERLSKNCLACHCRKPLSEHDRRTVVGYIHKIGEELDHAIDRHSAMIIASYIGLLLYYYERFCNNTPL